MCPRWTESYYEHDDQDVLLGDLGVREDVLQHRTHVRFVLFSQVDNTLIIVSCLKDKEKKNSVTIKEIPHLEFSFEAERALMSPC